MTFIEEVRRERGVCPECKVRNDDSSEKDLFECPHCGRLFCRFHLDPKPALIRNLKSPLTEMDVLLRREADREGGHPCFAYTKVKILELENERKRQSEALARFLDRSKTYRRAGTPRKAVTRVPEEGGKDAIHFVLSITAIFIVMLLLFLFGAWLASSVFL